MTMRTMGICHRGVAAAILALGLAIAALATGILNSEPLIAGSLPAELYQKDKDGLLVPRMAYPRFIERTYHFVLHDLDGGWAAGNAYKDQDGKAIPAYVNYALANGERKVGVGHPLNADTVYPAFHHSLFIRGFLAQWRYTGDAACLARARQLADWNLARRTPADCKFASLFYSTAHKGKVGGSVDGDAIMTDKPAIMALAMLELSGATGDAHYRQAAEAVAATLAKTQLPEGNWPFRVNPITGEVREAYTSSAIYAVILFEELDKPDGKRWRECRDKALKWILEGPVKTMQWKGFYEDVSPETGKNNLTNWDCIDTARWLIAHRGDNPEYLPMARRLHDWIAKEFVEKNNTWAQAEGLREQKCCFATMGVHTLHWAALLADFHAATGEASFKQRAIQACSLVTYWMREDGANRVGPTWGNEIWFSCHFGPALYMYDTLSRFPELLADTRPHLVKAGSAVRNVVNGDKKLMYTGAAAGQDVLLIGSRPLKVVVSGQELEASEWEYYPESTVLHIRRPLGDVEITW
ncbi:MAG: hypothetical protein NTW87_04870 [Planctomycetota bacterium]|nr:hypothetical protein [Planctomycetota bacterium]